MNPVELIPVQGSLVLRARGSELLILPQYIYELKKLTVPKEFAGFFMHQALINRPARKLFEAWLRKDKTLWKRTYDMVMNEIELDEDTVKAIENAEANEVADSPSDEPTQVEEVAETEEDKEPVKKKTAKKKSQQEKSCKKGRKKGRKKTATKPAKKKAAKKTAKKAAKKEGCKKSK